MPNDESPHPNERMGAGLFTAFVSSKAGDGNRERDDRGEESEGQAEAE